MNILGINAFHGDSSACILIKGKLIAAVEEERFARIKHWAGFPKESIKYCLEEAGLDIKNINHVAINRKPHAHMLRKILFAVIHRPSVKILKERLLTTLELKDVNKLLYNSIPSDTEKISKTHYVEHHQAHLSSSFFVSPFNEAALLSVDGFGDFTSTMSALGKENKIVPLERIFYPHSLGLFYTAITQYLGFKKYGDEYKVMGLAALGKPRYLELMRDIVRNTPNGFILNLNYFIHHKQSIVLNWGGVEPSWEDVYSPLLETKLGPARLYDEPISEKHADIAASLQVRYEEVFFNLLNKLHDQVRNTNLCLAGGCALNSVANGKIFDNTPFRELYIQPAAHDSGGAIGAAFYVYNSILGNKREFNLINSYWGPKFNPSEIESVINKNLDKLGNYQQLRIDNESELCQTCAKFIAEGKIVGWFQGRAEWGPRALGNRSIVVDPRRPDMKDILNSRIKRREPFRPFAPSILLEALGEYFEKDYPDPFMLKVYSIRPEKRKIIPAVTHVDGTGRLQTVSMNENPLYYKLIKEFANITGVPVVLNTSFNENEPIVTTPEEALNCFLRTRMDILVMGPFIIIRK